MTDSICAFPPNKVTQLDPKEPNEQMPSLWSDNGGLLWLTPQALAIFLELKNKIGKRKKGHNFYQANPPWEITVYVPVHEHTWVIFFFLSFPGYSQFTFLFYFRVALEALECFHLGHSLHCVWVTETSAWWQGAGSFQKVGTSTARAVVA